MYICKCVYVCMYIYISLSLYIYIYIYVDIYICVQDYRRKRREDQQETIHNGARGASGLLNKNWSPCLLGNKRSQWLPQGWLPQSSSADEEEEEGTGGCRASMFSRGMGGPICKRQDVSDFA